MNKDTETPISSNDALKKKYPGLRYAFAADSDIALQILRLKPNIFQNIAEFFTEDRSTTIIEVHNIEWDDCLNVYIITIKKDETDPAYDFIRIHEHSVEYFTSINKVSQKENP